MKFKFISKSTWFEAFMMFILICNSVVLIYSAVSSDEDVLNILYDIDDYFLYIYIIECFIKIIGLGLEKYFNDGWNKFDFIMVILSIFSSVFF